MTDPQIPTAATIIAPGIDKLVSLRPAALAHINAGRGRYAYFFRGLKAQAALLLRRMAAEAVAKRIDLAHGDELHDLAASEFFTYAPEDGTKAIGSASLTRTATSTSGVIRKGTKFYRAADPKARVPIQAATYEASVDTPYFAPYADCTVPLVATQVGAHANTPIIDAAPTTGYSSEPLNDPTFTVTSILAAGGSTTESDDDLVTQAKAYSDGQFAPNDASILAGALQSTGVRHAALVTVTSYTDYLGHTYPCAYTNLAIADESWASSPELQQRVAQQLADQFLGFGCTVAVNGVFNVSILISADVMLRDASYLSDTVAIQAAIQKDLRAYFDLRPDWYTFKASQVRAVIARAHRKILTCSNVTITRGPSGDGGVPITATEPPPPSFTNLRGSLLTHFFLADNAVTTNFLAPT